MIEEGAKDGMTEDLDHRVFNKKNISNLFYASISFFVSFEMLQIEYLFLCYVVAGKSTEYLPFIPILYDKEKRWGTTFLALRVHP